MCWREKTSAENGSLPELLICPLLFRTRRRGIAVLGFVSRDSWLGQFASALGFDFVGSPAGIAIAMAFVSIPFLINAARDGFASVPVRLEQAAYNLGASPVRMFFSISLPLAWRHILSGFVLMFARWPERIRSRGHCGLPPHGYAGHDLRTLHCFWVEIRPAGSRHFYCCLPYLFCFT